MEKFTPGKIFICVVFLLLFISEISAQTKEKVDAKPLDSSQIKSSLPNKNNPKDKIFAKLYITSAGAEKIAGEPMQIQSESDKGIESFCKY